MHTTQVHGVRITHADRPMFPRLGVTKEDLARYYEAVGPWMVPYVQDRPLTLVLCPRGAPGPCTFMRHHAAWGPSALRRVRIREKTKVGEYLVADSTEALIALVQMDVLEVHTWNARCRALEKPDRLVFDLDPGPGVPWAQVVEAAGIVRDALATVDLESFPKTTGGAGLHVVVPLAPRASWEEAFGFARGVAKALARAAPARFTASMVKRERAGRIYVDYLRNHRAASSIAEYSARARPDAPVAAPVSWEELRGGLRPGDLTIHTVVARLRAHHPHDVPPPRQHVTRAMARALEASS